MGKIKRKSYEIVIVTIVVSLAVVLAVSLYASRAKYRKGDMLSRELSTMRSALTTYKLLNKRNAADINALVGSDYEMDGVKRTYLDMLPMSEDGKIIDPFGNPYLYNPSTGWISSVTPGYERW